MRFVRSLLVGLRALVDKHGRNAEIDEELEAYIGESVSEKMRAGMSLKEAVRTTRAEVGSAEVVKHKVWNAGWESWADRLWNDVIYSLMRHKDPAVASKAKTLADQIKEAKATGPNEVTITLSGANADLPVILADSHFMIIKDGTRTV